jgi:endonuclease YncB( thermonuclease family)
MSLNGVRTTNDQWGKEATEYLRERIFQRDVKVRIEVSHSTGSTPSRRRRGGGKDKHSSEPEASTPQYFGEIIVNEKDGDINIAHELINKGLIRVVVRRRRKEAGGRRVEWIDETDPILRAIEDKARESLVGLWQEEAEREEKRDEERRAKFQTGETKNVRISYIATANSFWVIDTDSISDMSRVQSVLATAKRDALRRVKSGSIVAALFDGEWARARVERRNQDQDNAWLVLFLDYGNRATIEEKNMSVLPDELRVTELEPLAHRCILAGTRVAPTSSHMHVWRAAGNKFAELTMERDLQVNVLFDDYDNRKWYVDLIIPAGKGAASAAAAVTPAEDATAPAPVTPSASASSITKVLVSEGLLRTDPKRLDNPEDLYTSEASDDAAAFLRDIQVMERSAREEKRGMWHGGDVADD